MVRTTLYFLSLWLICASALAQQAVTTGRTTYQGTVTLTAGVSTPLIASTAVTMTPGSGALPQPGSFGRLTVIAPGAGCNFTVNWNGGTATATSGEQFGTGTSVGTDTVDLTGVLNAPTLFSTSGCSSPNVVQFHN